MGDVDEYLAGLPPGPARSELERLHRLIGEHVLGLGQSISYAMPCYTYRGLPVAAVILRRNHIAWYPYSGTVLSELGDDVAAYSHSSGALRFSVADPLPDRLVRRLLNVRMRLIDERLDDSP
jgi:uncharacterized protein YdhG (YjbR/CyaY superfamily)